MSSCDERLRNFVERRMADQAAINAHICDVMNLAAQGRPGTDPTFRTPSATVATDFLNAFCDRNQ